jgi:hypothetical protein
MFYMASCFHWQFIVSPLQFTVNTAQSFLALCMRSLVIPCVILHYFSDRVSDIDYE